MSGRARGRTGVDSKKAAVPQHCGLHWSEPGRSHPAQHMKLEEVCERRPHHRDSQGPDSVLKGFLVMVETARTIGVGAMLGGRMGCWDFFLSYSLEPKNCAQQRRLGTGLPMALLLGMFLGRHSTGHLCDASVAQIPQSGVHGRALVSAAWP